MQLSLAFWEAVDAASAEQGGGFWTEYVTLSALMPTRRGDEDTRPTVVFAAFEAAWAGSTEKLFVQQKSSVER